ncbi:unnamed protein product [Cuscuta europaea]|uniref:Glycosyltransferase n=1 Tax=Cuscuta europaea TaxID=41803 RepID=A0A9P0YK29_CUSEU|nr:unnamed protein product [Cuscuta europaea]
MAPEINVLPAGGGGATVAVVMVPFPAQGHLNQLLQLSRLISSHHIPVHFVGTATHNRQARLRVHGWNPLSTDNIHFHEFPDDGTVEYPTPTKPTSSARGIPTFPAHFLESFTRVSFLRIPVRKLLRTLAVKNTRVIVIHDSLMGSVVQDAASIPNAESYIFHSVSAFAIFHFIWQKTGKPFAVDDNIIRDLPPIEGCFSPEFEAFISAQYEFLKFNSGRIYNTCRVLESPFLDLLSWEEIPGKHWALGPFNPVHVTTAEGPRKCLTWLDHQPQNSVIFVSFGTTTSFSDDQIQEIAAGLEQSGQKFIWVLRDSDKADIFTKENAKIELPKGYEERVREMGLVIRDWAPQLEVLAHPSTGGFLSHCGWNSCMESISMGVPMAAWPMHSDQPRNTILITRFLKIGIVVKDWDRRDQIVLSSTVGEAVKKLMASEEGRRMRVRAAEYGCALKKAAGEGGISRMELDEFVDHVTRI